MSKLYTSDVLADIPPTQARRAGAVLAGAAVGLAMMGLGVYALATYGAVLFLLTPFVMGVTASYVLHRGGDVDRTRMARVILVMLAVTGSALLVFALEGLICILMAFPVAYPFTLLASGGSAPGSPIHSTRRSRDAASAPSATACSRRGSRTGVIHGIHNQVLEPIKREAERTPRMEGAAL